MGDASWQGHYYDGRTPERRRVAVTIDETTLVLALETGATVVWPLAEIRQAQGANPKEPIRLERGAPLPEVLVLADASILAALTAAAPRLGRRLTAPPSGARRTGILLGALAGALLVGAALYLWVIPFAATMLARYVPIAWEEEIGRRVTEESFASEARCRGAGGEEALDAMMRALLDGTPGAGYTYRIAVLDTGEVNAFAAPGGYLLVLRGLIEATDRPEELAGVLAHEIQHVEQRHTTTRLLREVSAAALLTAATGDAAQLAQVLAAAQLLGRLHHNREAEASADTDGFAMLVAARLDPTGMASFHRKMARKGEEKETPQALQYLSTHPSSASRAETLELLAASATYEPVLVLTEEQWRALRAMCRSRPKP